MVFTCHIQWVTTIEDIVIKMFPRPLPSLISSVMLWLFYLSLLFWLKFERPTYNVYIQKIDNGIQPSCFWQSRRDFSSGRSKSQLTMINFTTAYILASFFFLFLQNIKFHLIIRAISTPMRAFYLYKSGSWCTLKQRQSFNVWN